VALPIFRQRSPDNQHPRGTQAVAQYKCPQQVFTHGIKPPFPDRQPVIAGVCQVDCQCRVMLLRVLPNLRGLLRQSSTEKFIYFYFRPYF